MTDTDLAPVDATAEEPPTPRRRPRVVTLLLSALALALAVVCVLLFLDLRSADAVEERRERALAAARQTAVNFTTIDFENVDRDLERVLEGATGEFAEDFEAGADELEKLVLDNKVESTGTVLAAALVSSDTDSAQVLLIVDSTVANSASPEGQVRRFRISMDLALEDDTWRTSVLEFVG